MILVILLFFSRFLWVYRRVFEQEPTPMMVSLVNASEPLKQVELKPLIVSRL